MQKNDSNNILRCPIVNRINNRRMILPYDHGEATLTNKGQVCYWNSHTSDAQPEIKKDVTAIIMATCTSHQLHALLTDDMHVVAVVSTEKKLVDLTDMICKAIGENSIADVYNLIASGLSIIISVGNCICIIDVREDQAHIKLVRRFDHTVTLVRFFPHKERLFVHAGDTLFTFCGPHGSWQQLNTHNNIGDIKELVRTQDHTLLLVNGKIMVRNGEAHGCESQSFEPIEFESRDTVAVTKMVADDYGIVCLDDQGRCWALRTHGSNRDPGKRNGINPVMQQIIVGRYVENISIVDSNVFFWHDGGKLCACDIRYVSKLVGQGYMSGPYTLYVERLLFFDDKSIVDIVSLHRSIYYITVEGHVYHSEAMYPFSRLSGLSIMPFFVDNPIMVKTATPRLRSAMNTANDL